MDNILLESAKRSSDHSTGFEYFAERLEEESKIIPIEYPFLEIGVRAGGSSELFMHAMQNNPRLFITIDPYGKDYESGGRWPAIGDETYRMTMKSLFKLAYGYKITHVHYRMRSQDFMSSRPLQYLWMNNEIVKEQYGIVYLDGEHVDSVVMDELCYFLPKMHESGLIVIDDISYLKDTKIDYIKKVMDIGHNDNNRLFIDVKKLL